MAKPSNSFDKIKTISNTTLEVIPSRLFNGSYVAELPTLSKDTTLITTDTISNYAGGSTDKKIIQFTDHDLFDEEKSRFDYADEFYDDHFETARGEGYFDFSPADASSDPVCTITILSKCNDSIILFDMASFLSCGMYAIQDNRISNLTWKIVIDKDVKNCTIYFYGLTTSIVDLQSSFLQDLTSERLQIQANRMLDFGYANYINQYWDNLQTSYNLDHAELYEVGIYNNSFLSSAYGNTLENELAVDFDVKYGEFWNKFNLVCEIKNLASASFKLNFIEVEQ
jgi:hypothetical protein